MTYKIVTKDFSTFTAADIAEDMLTNYGENYTHYMFLAKHVQYTDTGDNVQKLYDNEATKRQVYNDMLFGKKIGHDDIKMMIARNDYLPNVVYDMYDDTDKRLFNKKFFVVVKRGESYDVFKCLDNNMGAASTVPPEWTDTNTSDEIYRLSDGYVWKFMYTITSTDMNRFATTAYIPVIDNGSTSQVDGAIDVIAIDDVGARYDNYLDGVVHSGDLNIGESSSSTVTKIDIAKSAGSSSTANFYNGCIFKIISGTGRGTYTKIQKYEVSGSNRFAYFQTPLSMDLTSHYEISPEVRITGDYFQTSSAVARAIIEEVANSVSRVEILDRGSGYRFATADVYAHPVVSIGRAAVVRPIMGPRGGHGFNANSELGATRVCMSMTFDENVDDLPAMNDFRQVGILTNPRFSEVIVNFTSKDSTPFITDETIYQINPIPLRGDDLTTSDTSNSVSSSSNVNFKAIKAGSWVYLVGSSIRQLAKVASVANNSFLRLDRDCAFSCTSTEMYLANVSGPAQVIADGTDLVTVTNLIKPYVSGSMIIGSNSGAFGIVDNLVVAGQTTDLTTFNQMWKYVVNSSDTFTPDEIVYQTTTVANSHGRFFGLSGTDPNIMYVTNQFGIINSGMEITGAESLKSTMVTNKYQPDLLFNSGRISYLENLEVVTRESGQKETFKIISNTETSDNEEE